VWLNLYRSWEGERLPHQGNTQKILTLISRNAWNLCDFQQEGNDRDEKWKNIILGKMKRIKRGWSIIIVGARHVSGKPGCLISLLKTAGFKCDVTVLKP